MQGANVLRIAARAPTDVLFIPPRPIESKTFKFPKLGHVIPFKVKLKEPMICQIAKIRALGKIEDKRGNIGLVISTVHEEVTRNLFGRDLYDTDMKVKEAVSHSIPEDSKGESIFIVGAVRLEVHRLTVNQFLGFQFIIHAESN